MFKEIDNTHTVTPVDGDHGTVNDKTPVQTDKNGSITALPDVTPDEGYELDKWVTVPGGEEVNIGDRLDRDIIIEPVYKQKLSEKITITIQESDGGVLRWNDNF